MITSNGKRGGVRIGEILPQCLPHGKCVYAGLLSAFVLFLSFYCVQNVQAEKRNYETEMTQQKVKVKGVILDDVGEPLSGATVQLQGTTSGVIADIDGKFEMEVPPKCKLVVAYIGMVTKTIDYKGEKELTITLESNAKELEEVSVVAFAKQKKESVLASISTVKPSELKVPSSNLTTAFAGRVAGLISYQQSGEPGQDNASFFIRGITTFGAEAKKDPLILIDGIELSSEDLARLNTDDIASFSIMKDATATALYGARGANGVIAVTTKEGKEGKVSINVRLENSFSSPTKNLEISDPVTYMRMQNEAIKTRDPLGLNYYTEEKIVMTERGLYPDIFPTTDWYKTMFNNTTTNQRANMSLSGGGTVARYYVAANYMQDNGNIKVDKRNNFNANIDLKKIAVRSNVNVNVTKTTEMILRLSATFDDYQGPIDGGTDMYNKVIQANPVLFKPYYEPDEKYAYINHIAFGNYGSASYLNPYAEVQKGYREYSKNTFITQLEFKQKLDFITEGLTARAMFNFDRFSEYSVVRSYEPYYYAITSYNLMTGAYKLGRLNPESGREYLSYSPSGRNINSVFYFEGASEYNRIFEEKHNVNALLVYTMRSEKNGIALNSAGEPDLQLSLPKRNMGLSGRLAYNYDTRYFGEFNFGYNGSERFAKNNRWGFFPSVGAAWMVSNESFFESLKKHINTLKLKITYGLVGNDAIGSSSDRFYYLSDVNLSSGYAVDWGTNLVYNPGSIAINRYANDQIGWEISYKTNGGFELALKNGISANVDLFKETRKNILLSRTIPSTMGFAGVANSMKSNLGEAEGKGVDIELNYEKVVNKDLWLTGRATFTYATSKVLKWEQPDYDATPWLYRVGYSVAQNWGYIAERLFVDDFEVKNSPTQSFGDYAAGDIKYRDVNGDGKISELDKVPIGYPTTPEINYGFGLSVGYKNFDLSFFFQGSARQSFWLDYGKIAPFLDSSDNDGRIGQNAVLSVISDNYWSESNQNAYAFWPRLANYKVNNNAQTSTWFMQDATFIRLKSAEIGYTLPANLLKKIRLSNLRVYMSGTNLLCWSGFKLWDPEMAGNGLGYPIQRVINVGINIGI